MPCACKARAAIRIHINTGKRARLEAAEQRQNGAHECSLKDSSDTFMLVEVLRVHEHHCRRVRDATDAGCGHAIEPDRKIAHVSPWSLSAEAESLLGSLPVRFAGAEPCSTPIDPD